MPRQQPNPLQKLVREWIRDRIDEINNRQSPSPKIAQKIDPTRQSKSKSKSTGIEKHSRYIPAGIRVDVLSRDGYKCVFCGRNSQETSLEIDHIFPFSQGGSNNFDNLQTLCIDCNRGKGSRNLK
jgi:5-methylcytosine-specific restriction enzyme A